MFASYLRLYDSLKFKRYTTDFLNYQTDSVNNQNNGNFYIQMKTGFFPLRSTNQMFYRMTNNR